MTQSTPEYEFLWMIICDCETHAQLEKAAKLIASQQDLPEYVKAKLRVSYATKLRNLNVVEGRR